MAVEDGTYLHIINLQETWEMLEIKLEYEKQLHSSWNMNVTVAWYESSISRCLSCSFFQTQGA